MIMDMLRAHPHIIDLLGATWSDGMLCIITPWMENGTIGQFLSRNSPGIGCRDKLASNQALLFLPTDDDHGDYRYIRL